MWDENPTNRFHSIWADPDRMARNREKISLQSNFLTLHQIQRIVLQFNKAFHIYHCRTRFICQLLVRFSAKFVIIVESLSNTSIRDLFVSGSLLTSEIALLWGTVCTDFITSSWSFTFFGTIISPFEDFAEVTLDFGDKSINFKWFGSFLFGKTGWIVVLLQNGHLQTVGF